LQVVDDVVQIHRQKSRLGADRRGGWVDSNAGEILTQSRFWRYRRNAHA
jgi:hypothetical protein